MLTADLVHVRRRGDVLTIVPLEEQDRLRALELATAYVGLAKAHLNARRSDFMEACRAVLLTPRDERLGKGLLKLVVDRCTFEEGSALDPPALRKEVFLKAAALRRENTQNFRLDRTALLREVAGAHDSTPAQIEAALYADLPDAHLLRDFEAIAPEALVAGYETAQIQAVLLRAVKVTVTVRATPAAYRQLFRRLKFMRLLHRIERLADKRRGVRIEIDGPFALFESVTKYGLQLALAFPAISACEMWSLEAALRWGRDAQPLRFQLRGQGVESTEGAGEAALPDEVAALLAQLRATKTPWRVSVADAILDLPGFGLCIPDLEFHDRKTGVKVYLEVMGFWSREAVWKRVELAERGLAHPLVLAVSKHLRVSEAAIGDDCPAALYVYSRTMSAKAVLDRVTAVAKKVAVTPTKKVRTRSAVVVAGEEKGA